MWGIIGFLVGLALGAVGVYGSISRALKNVSQQLEDKIRTGSRRRLEVRSQGKGLVALTEQVEHLFNRIEQTQRIAQQEKKTLDMAISNIAHDIRTPLTIASGYTQQLLRASSERDQNLQKISTNLEVVSKRLEALLEYRRLMEGAIHLELEEVNVSQVVTQQVFAYYDAFQEGQIQMDLAISEDLHMTTDPDLLERLVQNILSNVLKHGKEQAHLALVKEGDQLRLTVRNIVRQPIQHLDQLAQRFYSENLSDTEESSGLGLYLIQNFTEILGGELALRADADWFELEIRL